MFVNQETRHTPLLLVGDVLGEHESKFNCHCGSIGAGEVGLDGGRQQDRVHGRGDHEEQDTLDERDEGPVEDVEHGFGNMLPDDLPEACQ
jgi:hypothetical protein